MPRKKASMRRQWKKVEEKHAELFGASRVKSTFPAMVKLGNTHGKNYPDWFDDFLAGESESGYEKIPNWLREIVDQSIINERQFSLDGDGQQRIPIAVIHKNGEKYNDDIVIIRSDIFREYFVPAIAALGKVMQMSWTGDKAT